MQNLSFGIISFKPTFTYIVGATVEVKAPDAPYTVLATGTTHHRGDVDLHIPASYTSVLVTVTASGYCTITDRLFQLPVGAGYWIDMTAGCI